MDLAKKRVIVIGGSSGLGLAIAQEAARAGASVVIAARSPERLQNVLPSIPGQVEGIQLDASKEDDVKRFFANIGSFDHLATPGSHTSSGSCGQLETEKARSSFDSKFWGQYHAAKYASPNIDREDRSSSFPVC